MPRCAGSASPAAPKPPASPTTLGLARTTRSSLKVPLPMTHTVFPALFRAMSSPAWMEPRARAGVLPSPVPPATTQWHGSTSTITVALVFAGSKPSLARTVSVWLPATAGAAHVALAS